MEGIDPVEWHSGTVGAAICRPKTSGFRKCSDAPRRPVIPKCGGVRVSRTQGAVLRQRLPPLFSPAFPS